MRQLRAGPRRQIVARLPAHHDGRAVPEAVPGDAAVAAASGGGADFIIIDDPLKPEEALSQAQRQAANEWYDHTLYSRLNDKLSGAIVLVMHRLHESLPSGLTRGTTSPVT